MVGSGEILVILVVILILFGGKKLPEFAQSLGKGIREFKKACYGEDEVSSTHVDKRFEDQTVVDPHLKNQPPVKSSLPSEEN